MVIQRHDSSIFRGEHKLWCCWVGVLMNPCPCGPSLPLRRKSRRILFHPSKASLILYQHQQCHFTRPLSIPRLYFHCTLRASHLVLSTVSEASINPSRPLFFQGTYNHGHCVH